jgi:tetratricopeptide (TPR) repeat protein
MMGEPGRGTALAREGHQILIELDARRELAEAKMHALLGGMAEDDARADCLLRESLSLARETDAPMEEAWALHLLGGRHLIRAILDGLPEEAWQWTQEAYDKALDIHRRIGHRRGEAILLQAQAQYAHVGGQYKKARLLYEESLALSRALGLREWILGCLRGLGSLALITGDSQVAQSRYLEGLEKAEAWGNPFEARYALCGLGEVALAAGEPSKADGFFRRGLQGAIEDGGLGAARIVLSMARWSVQRGDPARAVELLAFAYHCVEPTSEGELRLFGRDLEGKLQGALPPDVYAAAEERGKARDMEETLRELLAEVEEEVVRHGPEQDE